MLDGFSPKWNLHDRWKVKMTILPTEDDLPPVFEELKFHVTMFEFEVISVQTIRGNIQDVTIIFARQKDAPYGKGYKIHFRNDPVSIQKVVIVKENVEEILFENGPAPCYRANDLYEYIWDFPVFPLDAKGKEKIRFCKDEDNEEVFESIIKEQDNFVVKWETQGSTVSFEGIQRWHPGKPWYVKGERYLVQPLTSSRILYASAELIE